MVGLKNYKLDEIKKEIKDEELLDITLQKISKIPLEVNDFNILQLNKTSRAFVFLIRDIKVSASGQTPPLPTQIVGKKYFNGCEEFDIEVKMLLNNPSYLIKDKKIQVYPDLYSSEVGKCLEKKYIFRQYINEETLDKVAEKFFKGKEFEWNQLPEEIKAPIERISLLHIESDNLKYLLNLKKLDDEELKEKVKEKVIKYLTTIVQTYKKNISSIKESISETLDFFIKKFFKEEMLAVINGDLDTFPTHVTPHYLLDAGKTQIGYCVRDIALYTDPIFKIKDIEKVVDHYFTTRKNLEEILKSKSKLEKVTTEEMTFAFYLAGTIGNLRRAFSILQYNTNKEIVPSYLERSVYFLDKLEKIDERKVKEYAKKLKNVLESIFNK